MLVLPMPDYAHRYALWRNLIVTAGGQILKWSDRFDLSSLTKVSDGYTAGHIKYAVEQTLTDRRVIQVQASILWDKNGTQNIVLILQQKVRPLQAVEFISHLAKCEPVHKHEVEAFVQWYLKVCLFKE